MNIYPEEEFWDDVKYLAVHSCCPDLYTLILAFLEQIQDSEDAMWKLNKYETKHDKPPFNVTGIESLQSQGFNIFRLRPLKGSLSRYRIIYAYDNSVDDFYLLAIVEKPPEYDNPQPTHNLVFNYEPDHHVIRRICNIYDELLPRWN